MAETMWDLEIRMRVPFESLILYPDNSGDEYVEEPIFKKIREVLGINLDISPIIENIYAKDSIMVHYAEDTDENYILFDINIGNDQLDIITIGIRCTADVGGTVIQLAHELYSKRHQYNILYAEGNREIVSFYKMDFGKYEQVSQSIQQNIITDRNFEFYRSGILLRKFTCEKRLW